MLEIKIEWITSFIIYIKGNEWHNEAMTSGSNTATGFICLILGYLKMTFVLCIVLLISRTNINSTIIEIKITVLIKKM